MSVGGRSLGLGGIKASRSTMDVVPLVHRASVGSRGDSRAVGAGVSAGRARCEARRRGCVGAGETRFTASFTGESPLEAPDVQRAIAAAEARLSGQGRLLIRKSGTEPVIRVMAEAEDEALVEREVDDLCAVIGQAVKLSAQGAT